MVRQDSSTHSNKDKRKPSGNSKPRADAKCGQFSGAPSGRGSIARLSPYVRRTANRGSKTIMGGGDNPSSITQKVSSSAILTLPQTDALSRGDALKIATTFVGSVISLCNKSLASCGVMSEPAPREDMFLHLVSVCGIAEAKYWAETMGFEHQRSYRLFEALWYGNHAINSPKSQTRELIPAAIAGVTRSDECTRQKL